MKEYFVEKIESLLDGCNDYAMLDLIVKLLEKSAPEAKGEAA